MLIKMLPLHPTSADLLPLGEKKVKSEGSKCYFQKIWKKQKSKKESILLPKVTQQGTNLTWEHCPNKATIIQIPKYSVYPKEPMKLLFSFSKI